MASTCNREDGLFRIFPSQHVDETLRLFNYFDLEKYKKEYFRKLKLKKHKNIKSYNEAIFPSHGFTTAVTLKSVHVAIPVRCEEMVQYNIKDLFDES